MIRSLIQCFVMVLRFLPIVFIAVPAVAQTLPSYTITELSSLSGQGATAYGLNDNGQVVGSSYNVATGKSEAVIWNNGVVTSLGFEGVARDVNNYGVVVGESGPILGKGPSGRAYKWENGQYTDLGDLGGPTAGAYAINDSGEIAGSSYTSRTGPDEPQFYTHAFRYHNGSITDLGGVSVDSGYSRAEAINEAGVIAGRGSLIEMTNSEKHSVLWDADNTLSSLPSDFAYSSAEGINDNGLVVGNGYDANNQFQAFVMNEQGEYTFLDDQNSMESRATDINNQNVIVGFLRNSFPSFSNHEAVVSFDMTSFIGLETLIENMDGWQSVNYAYGINEQGQIIGTGLTSSGEQAAFLLTPTTVPVPAAAWLFGSALVGLAGIRRRR